MTNDDTQPTDDNDDDVLDESEQTLLEYIEEQQLKAQNELQELIMRLAFAIEDPCGEDEIRLAKAVVNIARITNRQNRKNIAREFEVVYEKICAYQREPIKNHSN